MRVSVAVGCLLLLLFTAHDSIAQKRRAVGHPEPPQTSGDRIARALASGTLDEATAITYMAFAAFGDCRLPAEYRGDQLETTDAAINEIIQAFPSLPADKRAIVEPFLLRPDDPRSWYAQRNTICPSAASVDEPRANSFEHLVTADGKAEIHFESDSKKDKRLADFLGAALSKTIWPKLTQLMRREPPTLPLPILLLNISDSPDSLPAYTIRQPKCGEPAKGVFTVINALHPFFDDWEDSCSDREPEEENKCERDRMQFVLAHELMHAFSYAYNYQLCFDLWFLEATAEWAAGNVFPDMNIEHKHMQSFLNLLPWRLRQMKYDSSRAYGANLFFLYLASRGLGDPDVVRRFFVAAEDDFNPLTAINTAIGEDSDGFTRAWHDFALAAINEDWYVAFQEWDHMTKKPKRITYTPGRDVEQTFKPLHPFESPVFLGSSIQYHHFTFDERHRAVAFIDGITATARYAEIEIDPDPDGVTAGVETAAYALEPKEPDDTIRVTTLVKRGPDDAWLESKSPEAFRTFCLDADAEPITEMLIVVSNAQVETDDEHTIGPDELGPLVRISDIGCDEWTGESTMDIGLNFVFRVEYKSHAKKVVWNRDDTPALIIRTDAEEVPNTKYVWGYRYKPAGTVTATGVADVPGFFMCTNVIGGEAPVDPVKSSLSTFNFAPPASPYARGYEGWGESLHIPVTVIGPCPPSDEGVEVYWMDVLDGTRNKVTASGMIEGSESVTSPLSHSRETWSFSPKPR